jgi:hypothetical protein
MLSLLVAIGAIFSPLAAVMAFLITYEEYSHHGLGRQQVLRRSLGAAAATLVFFLVTLVLVGWFLDHSALLGPAS